MGLGEEVNCSDKKTLAPEDSKTEEFGDIEDCYLDKKFEGDVKREENKSSKNMMSSEAFRTYKNGEMNRVDILDKLSVRTSAESESPSTLDEVALRASYAVLILGISLLASFCLLLMKKDGEV